MRRNLAIIAFILLAACISVIGKTVVQKSNNLNSRGASATSGSAAGSYTEFTGVLDGTPVAEAGMRRQNTPLAEDKGVDLFQLADITQGKSSAHLDRDDLGPFDRWRYDRCLSNAADKPTEQGVSLAIYLCQEQFLQSSN